MKKIFILLFVTILLCGCQNVNDMTIDDTLQLFTGDYTDANVYRVGYKFYLPSRMQIDYSGDFIEQIVSEDYTYYLYVDVVSYYNKMDNSYEENTSAYYSQKFEINNKISYLEINIIENSKYLIEIMYNYAKIEVMVNDDDLIVGVINSINILNNVQYNDTILENYFGDDVLNFTEEVYDIFKTNEVSDYEFSSSN